MTTFNYSIINVAFCCIARHNKHLQTCGIFEYVNALSFFKTKQRHYAANNA